MENVGKSSCKGDRGQEDRGRVNIEQTIDFTQNSLQVNLLIY